MRPPRQLTLTVYCLTAAFAFAGCGGASSNAPALEPTGAEVALVGAMAGTIADYAYLEGGGDRIVRGYGLVVGLAGNGSSEAPPAIRKGLIEQMKRHGIGSYATGTPQLQPARMIDDKDTAVVVVSAAIPPGTPRGGAVDMTVTALPQSQTLSLDGGTLFLTELKAFRVRAEGTAESKPLATGKGSIFVNPFAEDTGPAAGPRLRKGLVIGGGVTTEARKIRLILRQADYGKAQAIQDRVNERFQTYPKAAVGRSPSIIDINIPPAYRKNFTGFLELLMHVYVPRGTGQEAKARHLAKGILETEAPHESISLIWEAMGRQVVPHFRNLYVSPNTTAAYYAARAGARLGDHQATAVLARAAQSDSPLRFGAIAELGRAKRPELTAVLKGLLDSRDARVRVAAYEALTDNAIPAGIETYDVDGRFRLDVLPGRGNFMIYATRTVSPRIVLFGKGMQVKRSVYFQTPDGLITVHVVAGDERLGVYRRVGAAKRLSYELKVPFDVKSLVLAMGRNAVEDLTSNFYTWVPAVKTVRENGKERRVYDRLQKKFRGLGLTYSQVVGALYRMSRPEAGQIIPARFVLQRLPASGMIVPPADGSVTANGE